MAGLDLEPRDPHTGATVRVVVAVQNGDVPPRNGDGAVEDVGRAVAELQDVAFARAKRILVQPGAGGNAPAGAAVDQQGQSGAAVDAGERGHYGIADVRNPDVDERRMRINGCRACIHGRHPSARAAPGGADGSNPSSLTLLHRAAASQRSPGIGDHRSAQRRSFHRCAGCRCGRYRCAETSIGSCRSK